MSNHDQLDCVVVGYNEIPFERYESFLRQYGEDTEAYRDLQFSFVNLGGKKLDYPGLLNYVVGLAGDGAGPLDPKEQIKSGDVPNLAAVYLANFLRKRGFSAKYINLFQFEKEQLIECLRANPLCVAITTTFYVVNQPVSEMVEFIRSYNDQVKIIVGGPLIANHARSYYGDALKVALEDIGADIYVIGGEGELTLSLIVDRLKRGGSFSDIPNLAYIEDGKVLRTKVLVENNSLDENAINWQEFSGEYLGRTIQTRTARSCAFNCAFCNYPTRAGKLTLADTATIERELDSIQALGYVKNVVFIDDTFNVPLPRFKEICRMMKQKNYQLNWYSYFRCSNSDEEAVSLMADSGCKGVFLGIESGSPAILKNMNKAATVEKYSEGIKLLHQHDILTFASFIIGFPGETDQTVQETIDFIQATRPHYYRAQSWYCEPGTPIDHHRQKYGITGSGFVWSHAGMDSLEAMDHIERLFLTIAESQWLPQWSFDFWVIPYLLGKGISVDQFRTFMEHANKLLALEIASVPEQRKAVLQQDCLKTLVEAVKAWGIHS